MVPQCLLISLPFKLQLKLVPYLLQLKRHFVFSVQDEAVIFASRSSGTSSATNPVPFNQISVNHRQRWNEAAHNYAMNAVQGLLWVGLIAGARSGGRIEYILTKDGADVAGIKVLSTSHNNVLNTGREFALKMHSSEILSVKSNYALYSDTVLQSGLTILSLNDAMIAPVTAFCVARDESLSGFADPIPFNVDVYNEDFHYNWISHGFHSESSGLYYFSFSVGVQQGQTAEIILYKNLEPFASLVRQSTSHNGDSTMSRSIMMTLEFGDIIHIVNNRSQVALSSKNLETSFSGFKYEPVHRNPVNTIILFSIII